MLKSQVTVRAAGAPGVVGGSDAWAEDAESVSAKRPRTDERLVAIVDDDASVRQSTCRLLRSLGFQAEAFGSAEDFLAAGPAAKTACVILDVRMSGMDGLELQRRLANRDPRIPIVFFTAHASDEEERRARSAGAIDFLRKPVAKETLLGVIRTALETSAGEREDVHDE